MVAHTGFEPVVSSLRGKCPKPLDECAVYGGGLVPGLHPPDYQSLTEHRKGGQQE